jgi:hypothetical protein
MAEGDGTGEVAASFVASKVVERPVFTPEFEGALRESIRFQIDNPVDQSDYAPHLTRGDLAFLGFHGGEQERATMTGITKEKAHRWFELLREEVDNAIADGTKFNENVVRRDQDWKRIEDHEIAHMEQAVAVGCSAEKMRLSVSFGKDLDDDRKDLGLAFTVSVGQDTEEWSKLDVVDKARVNLAPEAPVYTDIGKFVADFNLHSDEFITRPVETWKLLRKFKKATGMNMAQLYTFVKGSIEYTKQEQEKMHKLYASMGKKTTDESQAEE